MCIRVRPRPALALRPGQRPPRLRHRALVRRRGPGGRASGRGPPELWRQIWNGKPLQIAILTAALAVLAGIFFFQDQLARRPLLHDRLRLAFLLFALFWIGWYGQAQLSVVNVLTFFSALRSDFRWDYFLMDPLVFILWCATAVSMVFWNRGAFCGWLCPFGALQELLNRAAKRLGVKQLQVPHGVNQRLSALKYIIFVLLFGYALYDLALAERLAEVEPFKTAIILRFARAWPFVLFAALLLAAGSSSNASIAATCARWARRWRFPRACASSTGSSAITIAAIPASAATTNARCRPSSPAAKSIPTSASSACTARCSTTTTKSARTCCSARPGANAAAPRPPRPRRRKS